MADVLYGETFCFIWLEEVLICSLSWEDVERRLQQYGSRVLYKCLQNSL